MRYQKLGRPHVCFRVLGSGPGLHAQLRTVGPSERLGSGCPIAALPRPPVLGADEPRLTSLSRSFSRKWRATWLGRMFRSMFSLCSLSSFISLISSLAWTRHRKSRRAVYSSCGSGDRRGGRGSDTRLWEVDRASPEPSAHETEPEPNISGGLCLTPGDRKMSSFYGPCASHSEHCGTWDFVVVSFLHCALQVL